MNTTKLALNEACEAPYAYSTVLLNAGSFALIAPAALFALFTLARIHPKDEFGRQAVLAQALYHCTHAYIHATVDMGVRANAVWWNQILVFHFAHQAGTLGALHLKSFRRGLALGFGGVYLAWYATGMIYPAVWAYLLMVFVFRAPMGWPLIASSVYTGLATMVEVRMCNPVALRAGAGGFPFHVVADLGQALSVLFQCLYLAERSRQFEHGEAKQS